jgi:hypothetical protein
MIYSNSSKLKEVMRRYAEQMDFEKWKNIQVDLNVLTVYNSKSRLMKT